MNIELPTHIDKPTFLAWVQGREERYELVRGRVAMMVGASRNHGRIVANLVVLLRAQLDSREWEVIADFGLDAGPDTLRYPDIVVDRAGGGGRDYTASMPVLLIDVLSFERCHRPAGQGRRIPATPEPQCLYRVLAR